jgi:CRP/FNR family cyclic AMP-dependent transcriptional regulator
MRPSRRLPTRPRSAQKGSNFFDPTAFLANPGVGQTIRRYKRKQAVFSQGDPADAVFYIQEGRVRLSVLSKQGKKATIALLRPRRVLG